MLHTYIIAVGSEINTEHLNTRTLCDQNVEFCNVKPGSALGSKGSQRIRHLFEVSIILM
jgi:hypothetical protein